MNLQDLNKEYDKLQKEYGAKELDSIYNGGCSDNPNICFVFMNPTGRNIASAKSWKGSKQPWIGTKNIWDLFAGIDLIDKDIYKKISVSQVRKQSFIKKINDKEYKFYSVYYPVGNGRFNIDKSIEDIKWIIENELKTKMINQRGKNII